MYKVVVLTAISHARAALVHLLLDLLQLVTDVSQPSRALRHTAARLAVALLRLGQLITKRSEFLKTSEKQCKYMHRE